MLGKSNKRSLYTFSKLGDKATPTFFFQIKPKSKQPHILLKVSFIKISVAQQLSAKMFSYRTKMLFEVFVFAVVQCNM